VKKTFLLATKILHESELKISVILKDEKVLHWPIETSKCFKEFFFGAAFAVFSSEEFWIVVGERRLRRRVFRLEKECQFYARSP
jgi:hypothetical protein